jgi:hypothetical protein
MLVYMLSIESSELFVITRLAVDPWPSCLLIPGVCRSKTKEGGALMETADDKGCFCEGFAHSARSIIFEFFLHLNSSLELSLDSTGRFGRALVALHSKLSMFWWVGAWSEWCGGMNIEHSTLIHWGRSHFGMARGCKMRLTSMRQYRMSFVDTSTSNMDSKKLT